MNFNTLWYQERTVLWPLIPFSFLYQWVVTFRKILYQKKIFSIKKIPVPVIVIGNITVGGTGKTPLVIYLSALLKKQGLHPGIVSKGYKGSHSQPTAVYEDSDPKQVGDEAILMAKKTHCPVVVGHDRTAAAELLLQKFLVDIIISDDGLQHYALSRQLEIAVVDGERRFGNEYCLPVGPLREPISRLNTVNMVVINNGISRGNEYEMYYKPEFLYQAIEPEHRQLLETFKNQKVHAIAGIGNPKQFF